MEVRKTAEDYLEAILMIRERQGYVRSVDIAEHLKITKPSVSYSTKRLKEDGYIYMDHASMIFLTEKGMAVATKIYTRHRVLTDFFTFLGVSPAQAHEDACKVEHDLSPETFEALQKHVGPCLLKKEEDAASAESRKEG